MSLKDLAQKVRAEGRGKDDQLVHLTSREVAGLHQLAEAAGGKLTTNPKTGLPEAGFLDNLLPSLLGFGAMFIPGMQPIGAAAIGAGAGALTNKENPLMGALMGGLGAYGGAGLGAGLQGVGVNAAQQTAMQAAQPLAQQAVGQGLQAGATQGLQAGLTQGLTPNVLAPELVGQTAAQNTLAANATTDFLQKPFYEQAMAGGKAMMQPGGLDQFVQGQGGMMPTMKNVGMAAAPMLYDSMMPKPSGGGAGEEGEELPKYKYAAELTGNYYQPGQGTYERQYFSQPTFQRMASGGIVQLAKGGSVPLESGDFVIPADVVAYAGGGSTEEGYRRLNAKLGAIPLTGAGGGLDDHIEAHIDGHQPARVANGEMLIKQPGKEGTKKLYAMLDRIRKEAVGHTNQIKPVDLDRALA